MEKFVRTIFTSFTVWVAAALSNAAMVAAWSLTTKFGSGEVGLTFGMVFIFSLLFSIPGIFIFWIFFIANYHEQGLFQLLLKTSLFTSFFSALFFFGWLDGFRETSFWFVLFAVVAAIASLMVHHSVIVNIVNNNKNQIDV